MEEYYRSKIGQGIIGTILCWLTTIVALFLKMVPNTSDAMAIIYVCDIVFPVGTFIWYAKLKEFTKI